MALLSIKFFLLKKIIIIIFISIMMIKEMSRNYRFVKFVNLSMSSLGIFSIRWMLHVLRHDELNWHWQKAATLYNQDDDKHIFIIATYCIFCCRNRNWDSPDLISFLFFWIIQCKAAFVNCLYVAKFTIVHSKTQIKVPLLLLLLLLLLLSILLLLFFLLLFNGNFKKR